MAMMFLLRLIRTKWSAIVLLFNQLWGRLLSWGHYQARTPEQALKLLFPDARERLNKVKKGFIDTLDQDAVCALASRHNNGKPCRVIGQDNGSFNVCFFIEFDTDTDSQNTVNVNADLVLQKNVTKWVVRIPIEPAIHNPWDKIRSEVATLQYLQNNTRIPVPSVYAYGCNETLGKTGSTHMYLITNFIPGTPLKIATFLESSAEIRASFYSQIIDILAELSQLEFPAICSLMPEGRFIGPLSPSLNERRQTLPIFTSATDYMKAHWENIKRHAEILDEDLTEEDIRDEIFVLHHLKPYFHELSPTNPSEKGPFVLSHPDFRCGNTIVDEHMNIQGVIDWEFASTIPRCLLSPPSWITNHDGHTHLQFAIDKLYNQFVKVLEEKSEHSSVCAQLQKEWFQGVADRTSNAFRVAYLVRWPGEISHIFLDFFKNEILGDGDESQPMQKEAEFFQQHPHLMVEARRRVERSEEYTKYLKHHGLYEVDENKLALNKLQSELDAKTKKLGMDRIILR